MESLTATEVEIKGVRFQIRKLLPDEAFTLYETLRPALSTVSKIDWGPLELTSGDAFKASVATLTTKQIITICMDVITAIPADTVKAIRPQLFQHVLFTSEAVPTPRPLHGNVDVAFKDLGPFYIYEVLIRSLAVNFTESWADIESRLFSSSPASIPSPSET